MPLDLVGDPGGYDALFDFTRVPFAPWLNFLSYMLVVGVAGYMMFAAADFLGRFMSGLFAVVGMVYALYALIVGTNSHAHLSEDISQRRVSYVEGHFSLVGRSASSTHYAIADEEFEIPEYGETRAWKMSRSWARENLSGRCVRAVFNARREIVWLGIRKNGCET